ncbi:helix-turn-helix domain-containing protein [Rhodopirellula halodulae]|uniref:helix-turn-helix domain-containing protein n=1 Tax=Rhodopirellula halodulae TaxID=2894198 RepID=UPI001E3392A6|nr:helix-turn-helix domain-containing protein [Rhodopirellula sp. JC737]MCC9654666.1 helix-turn-helix domain-containing protein [Rhodopirellula sp. JC737]
MTPRTFGAQIRIRRLEKHLEQAQLAQQLWISPQHLASLEHGEFEEGDDDLIEKLDVILDSPLWDRLAFDGFRQLFPKRSTLPDPAFVPAFGTLSKYSPVFFSPCDQTCPPLSQC